MSDHVQNMVASTHKEAWHPPQRESVISVVEREDPVLLTEARPLVELCDQFVDAVTVKYGSPDRPEWASGETESTIMLYHNGESRHGCGHTSIGGEGVGIIRNSMRLTSAIDRRAGYEAVGPRARVRVLVATAAHDVVQLCGRSIVIAKQPQGGNNRGDEVESADAAYNASVAAGATQEDGEQIAINVLATMYDPDRSAQAVDYSLSPQSVLEQEIVACSDMLGIVQAGGATDSIKWSIEEMGLSSKGSILQRHMVDKGVPKEALASPEQLLDFIDSVPTLRTYLISAISGQAKFISNFRFSDSQIRATCGAGVDELFAGGRQATVNKLSRFVELSATKPLRDCFEALNDRA